MSSCTLTKLIYGDSRAVVISGEHIYLIDTLSGDVLDSTSYPGNKTQAHTCAILYASLDSAFRHLATSDDGKLLKIWNIASDRLLMLSSREIPKKATGLAFTKDGQTLIVADKFGDVFSYSTSEPVESKPAPLPPNTSKRQSVASHDNTAGGQLVLGHASIITSFILTPDEKYIITADRDEHIRVSWYPQGYVIDRFCLGHTKFVSALCLLSSDPSVLISAGGDSSLYVWEWKAGKLIAQIPTMESISPFLLMSGGRKAWKRLEHKKRKGREDGSSRPQPAPMTVIAAGMEIPRDSLRDKEALHTMTEDSGPGLDDDGECVLVVSKIESFRTGTQELILFSAVGSSALFYMEFPFAADPSKSIIRYVDFGKPVLDFTLRLASTEVWVSLDTSWKAETTPAGVSDPGTSHFKCLHWENEHLVVTSVEVAKEQKTSAARDLQKIFDECCVPNAETSAICFRLYYGLLTALPKSEEAEFDGQGNREEEFGDHTSYENVGKTRGHGGHDLQSKYRGGPGSEPKGAAEVQGAQGTANNSKKTKI